MKKKIKISLILSLAIIFGCFSNVFAATKQNNKADKISQVRKNARFLQSASTDDGVVGTSNLNGTADNSAKVGDHLYSPEKGWKRYDDLNSKIVYIGPTSIVEGSSVQNSCYYNGSQTALIKGSTVNFKFYGSKIRIITDGTLTHSRNVDIKIDGVDYSYSNNHPAGYQYVSFEKANLNLDNHEVVISPIDDAATAIDAIDIDASGCLIDPSTAVATGISLNKTTDSLILNDSTKGADTLIATVTPDSATNKTINWTSSDSSIVTVDKNGNIKAIGKGTATITATIDGTNLSASCTVTVTEPSNNRVTLTINMVNGSTKQYDLSASELSDFLSWYNGMTNPVSSQCYTFNNPTTGPYLNNKDYIPFNKIDDFKVQEYTK